MAANLPPWHLCRAENQQGQPLFVTQSVTQWPQALGKQGHHNRYAIRWPMISA